MLRVWASINSVNTAVSRIRLTRKLAPIMNGVDVSQVHVGDVIEVSDDRAEALVASGWAEPVLPDTPLTHPVLSTHERSA
jgi:hypothetical protein